MQQLFVLKVARLTLSGSIGIAMRRLKDIITTEQQITLTDGGMYAAKNGKNGVSI